MDLAESLYRLGLGNGRASGQVKNQVALRLMQYLSSPLPDVRWGALAGLSYVATASCALALERYIVTEARGNLRGIAAVILDGIRREAKRA